jgi:hypothetical protein
MFFQVTFTRDGGDIQDDIVLEEVSHAKAKWYAEHRAEAYGYEGNPVATIKRISREKAQAMYDANAICWTQTLD